MTMLELQRGRQGRGRPARGRFGQVATYLVVWTAVLVLLTAVLMNIGHLAAIRTTTANAADGAAMSLASGLGATARHLCSLLDSSGNCEIQCSDHAEFVLNILFAVLLIVVAIILCIVGVLLSVVTAGASLSLCVASVGLILGAIAQIVVTAIKVGAITPHQIAIFNERMEELSDHDRIRESTLLTGFIQIVDDARQEPDNEPDIRGGSDIDRDGDTAEMVGAFAKWFNRRLIQLDRDMIPARNLIRRFVMTILMVFREHSHAFRNWMEDDFIQTLRWIEQDADPARPWDIPWWQDGLQLPNLNTYPGDGTRVPNCEPGVTCPVRDPVLPDDVDWMLGAGTRITARGDREIIDGTPRAFEAWIRALVRCRADNEANCAAPPGSFDPNNFRIRRRTVRKLRSWQPVLQGYWLNQMAYWRELVAKWIVDLSYIQDAMCARFGSSSCLPPGVPLPDITGSGHPIDVALERLRTYQQQLDAVMVETTAFLPRNVSRNRPIYRWHDERGWHYVRVEVSDFILPHAEAAQNLVWAWEDTICSVTAGVCMESCVGIEGRQGTVTVRVTRFDEDQMVNRGWTLRLRDIPDPNSTHTDFDFTNVSRAHMHAMLDKYGVTSTARARYSWRPNSVQMSRVR